MSVTERIRTVLDALHAEYARPEAWRHEAAMVDSSERQVRLHAGQGLCARCGLQLTREEDAERGVCLHHVMENADNWAAANRAWCDFIHRGIELPRVPLTDAERLDYFIEVGMGAEMP